MAGCDKIFAFVIWEKGKLHLNFQRPVSLSLWQNFVRDVSVKD